MDNGGHKRNPNTWTHSLTSLHTTHMEPRLDTQGDSDVSPCHLKCGIIAPINLDKTQPKPYPPKLENPITQTHCNWKDCNLI